ncbi:ZYBA0S10-03488g1_1 [Zygosaccharomyces bailii CLIB 213]|uniref:RNA helicase n=1 Tax=Zygosaccharomyces bailii (strain CLIB 213 / ATCC 58445 / CBS 680 / BCRC 21525 / NBRC 1098 / NCYC 1416 / NRRL Y-2227) TaxID=1333698 RepID=A0A8J2XAA5_ZYGB2|nr:ZYBA0S10-03488g1_1 [Zygosaccharomyces bailii CLIB 213]
MADLTNQVGNLNIDENASSYVPPHLRNSGGRRPRNNDGGDGAGYSNKGSFFGRGGGRGRGGGGGFRGGSGAGSGFRPAGTGRWVNGKHVPAPRNEKLEVQLFGVAGDPNIQSSGINFDNYDDIPVEASGDNVPEPVTEFTSPPLDELLLENIKFAHFTKPTPVQKYSIPIVANKRDLMACAQTGSGKTGGFLFPVLSESFGTGPSEVPESARGSYMRKAFPTAVVLAPTRELATQIFDEAKKFTYRSWVRPTVVYGGSDVGAQMRDLDRGCDLLVATPGRLNDLLERGKISLVKVKYLVLDEADRMLDMGFEPQIRHIVEGCDMPSVEHRQTLMFSATFPVDIQHLARDFLSEYVFLSVGRVGSTSENITQRILYVEDEDKKSALLDLLSASSGGLTLIFVETKRMADQLTDFLIMQDFRATAIHGDRTQSERERALSSFKSGKADLLVATAVAARGLDIPNVTHVINYDLPGDIDDYVHRIGRTGRAGNTGLATAFLNRGNKNVVKGLVELLSEANQEVPPFLNELSRESSFGSSRGGRGGSGFFNNRASGSRDYRKQGNGSFGASRGGTGSSWGSSRGGGAGAGSSWGSSSRTTNWGSSGSSGNSWW